MQKASTTWKIFLFFFIAAVHTSRDVSYPPALSVVRNPIAYPGEPMVKTKRCRRGPDEPDGEPAPKRARTDGLAAVSLLLGANTTEKLTAALAAAVPAGEEWEQARARQEFMMLELERLTSRCLPTSAGQRWHAWTGTAGERRLILLMHARLAQSVATCQIKAHALWFSNRAMVERLGRVLIVTARAIGAEAACAGLATLCGPGKGACLTPSKAARYAACFLALHAGHEVERGAARGGAEAAAAGAAALSWRILYVDKCGIGEGAVGTPQQLFAYIRAVVEHIARCVDEEEREGSAAGVEVASAALPALQRRAVTHADFDAVQAGGGGADELVRLARRVPHGRYAGLASALSRPAPLNLVGAAPTEGAQ